MIIQEMHWEFKQRGNKLDSNHYKDLSSNEIDARLNDAAFIFSEIMYSGNSLKQYKLGFEVTQQRIDMLSTLVVGQPKQPLVSPTSFDSVLGIYEFDLSALVQPYFHLLRVTASTQCGLVGVKLEQHDDLTFTLSDKHRKPSLKWKRLIGAFKSSVSSTTETSLYIYTNNEFTIDGLYIEYLKCPAKVYLGDYDSLEYLQCVADAGSNCEQFYNQSSGTPTGSVDCDLPAKYHTFVVDIAVQEMSRILEDGNRFNLKQNKIQTLT
jgi:hypothetical protein